MHINLQLLQTVQYKYTQIQNKMGIWMRMFKLVFIGKLLDCLFESAPKSVPKNVSKNVPKKVASCWIICLRAHHLSQKSVPKNV